MSTRFTALEIGSGDAFLLEDEGKTILFDSGGSKSKIESLLKKRWNRKRKEEESVNRLNLAICSHNDGDHANGFIGLLKSKIVIDEIWLPYWWASILQYATEHEMDWYEVETIYNDINEKSIKDYNPEFMFSKNHEPQSDEAFGKVLSRLAERRIYMDNPLTPYRLCYRLAYDIAHNMFDRLAHDKEFEFELDFVPDSYEVYLESHDIADWVASHRAPSDITLDVARDIAGLVAGLVAHTVAHTVAYHSDLDKIKSELNRHKDEFLPPNSPNYLMTANSGSNIRIMFNNIMEIAALAYKRGCKIKWFEPTKGCTLFPIPDTNFIALNSTLKREVQQLRDTISLAFALRLTVENEYSLAFEYLNEDRVPIVRFSADSDCECGSLPYDKSIIITAPHHGSEANANVYDAIDPNNQENIIWVRSDALNKTQGRPCSDFKLRKNKYCLACKNRIRNKKIEVCFEYDILIRKWKSISGYQCIC